MNDFPGDSSFAALRDLYAQSAWGDGIQAESLLAFTRVVVADSRVRIARLPNFHVVDVHHSNHYLFLQHPREVTAAMRAFLGAELGPSAP